MEQVTKALQSHTLRSLSALDPILRGHLQAAIQLKKLSAMLSHLSLAGSDLHQEIMRYNIDPCLASFTEEDDMVEWWAHVLAQTLKYPALGNVVKGALSVFHGTRVESLFSWMNDIIDTRSPNMNISTFNAMQTVKYTLQSRQKTTVEMFKQEDARFGEVDQRLCRNIRSAGTVDKTQWQRSLLEDQRRHLGYGCRHLEALRRARRR